MIPLDIMPLAGDGACLIAGWGITHLLGRQAINRAHAKGLEAGRDQGAKVGLLMVKNFIDSQLDPQSPNE